MFEELLNKIDKHVHWEKTNPEANNAFNRLKKELVKIKKPSTSKQSLPCRWCGYPLNAKLQCINESCDHCGE